MLRGGVCGVKNGTVSVCVCVVTGTALMCQHVSTEQRRSQTFISGGGWFFKKKNNKNLYLSHSCYAFALYTQQSCFADIHMIMHRPLAVC